MRNQVANAWNQIDVQLKRRHDLIPNLVETVKGAMSFERETLEAVIAARGRAVAAAPVGVAGTPPTRRRRSPDGRRRGRADGRARAAAGGRRVLPAAEGDRERLPAAGGDHLDGEQDRLRAPALQRPGDGLQHRPAGVSRATLVAGHGRRGPRRAVGDRRRRRARGAQGQPGSRRAVSDDAPDLFEQQEINRKRSRWLIVVLRLVLRLARVRGRLRVARGDAAAGASAGYEYFFPWLTVAHAAGRDRRHALCLAAPGRGRCCGPPARGPLTEPRDAAEKQLLDVVEEMAIAAGHPAAAASTSSTTTIRTPSPPGATSATPASSSREGMLRVCTRDELQAVVAHEMGHIKNLDVRLMTLLAALVGAVALMSNGVTPIMFGVGVSSNDDEQAGRGDGARRAAGGPGSPSGS